MPGRPFPSCIPVAKFLIEVHAFSLIWRQWKAVSVGGELSVVRGLVDLSGSLLGPGARPSGLRAVWDWTH